MVPAARTSASGPETGATTRPTVVAGSAALAQHLRREGTPWIGTPYRYGGQSRAGMDCSGFVRTLMREALGVELTRSTSSQVEEGVSVAKEDLFPGDLVFFRRRGTRHVGVYLGEGEFIHASSSNGVIVSRLDEDYYERHYWTSRRVLEDPRRVALSSVPGRSPNPVTDAPLPEPSPARPDASHSRQAERPKPAPPGTTRSAW